MNNNSEKFYTFLNPEMLKEKLILISLFIAVYENFKNTIVINVKYFYWSGYENGKEYFDYYERDVLNKIKSKQNRQIKATLRWLKEAGAMTEEDEQSFIKITDMRNVLVHNMSSTLYEGLPVFCKNFFLKVASNFSIVLQLHFPQCCKFYFPTFFKGGNRYLQTFVPLINHLAVYPNSKNSFYSIVGGHYI